SGSRIGAESDFVGIFRLPNRAAEAILEGFRALRVQVAGTVAEVDVLASVHLDGQPVVLVVGLLVGGKAEKIGGAAIGNHAVELTGNVAGAPENAAAGRLSHLAKCALDGMHVLLHGG